MSFDDLRRSDGSYIYYFRDMVNAAAAKYGSDQGLREATFLQPAHPRQAFCACGGYHTVSDDDLFDDSDYYSDDSLFLSGEDEDEDMIDVQQAYHLGAFMAASMANPYYASAFGF